MTARLFDGWVLKYPGGTVPQTFACTKRECWTEGAFQFAATVLGDEWRWKYWKRMDASIRDAERRGYRLVKVRLVEVE